MEEFKAGDVVFLKSGSPAMTVKAVVDDNPRERVVVCNWFEDGKVQENEFYQEQLSHQP